MGRQIKFRAWVVNSFRYISSNYDLEFWACNGSLGPETSLTDKNWQQYTGLKDKNGRGLIEVWEGDIIGDDGKIKGTSYEMDAGETDLVIPQLGTKAWGNAYKTAVERGYDYAE